jgi:hypothetical protein
VVSAARKFLDRVVQDDAMAPVLKSHVEANLLKFAVDDLASLNMISDKVGIHSTTLARLIGKLPRYDHDARNNQVCQQCQLPLQS